MVAENQNSSFVFRKAEALLVNTDPVFLLWVKADVWESLLNLINSWLNFTQLPLSLTGEDLAINK